MHKGIPSLLFIGVISVSFFSCLSQRKVRSGKKDLVTVDSVLTRQEITLKDLDEQRRIKQEENEMDDTSSSRIRQYISKTREEIGKMHEENTVLIAKTNINKEDWERLLKTLSFSENSSRRINQKIIFLTDLISQNTVVKIDLDVVFEPGRYTVSPIIASTISRIFEPAASEIDRFTVKYPDFPLSLVITAKGYADATTITEGSQLYHELKERIKLSGTEPDNKALNKELSNARAQEVINLFKKFAAERAGNKSYLRNVLYLYEGRGENLPNPKITDYRLDDPRRRVVYLFWSVFPE